MFLLQGFKLQSHTHTHTHGSTLPPFPRLSAYLAKHCRPQGGEGGGVMGEYGPSAPREDGGVCTMYAAGRNKKNHMVFRAPF